MPRYSRVKKGCTMSMRGGLNSSWPSGITIVDGRFSGFSFVNRNVRTLSRHDNGTFAMKDTERTTNTFFLELFLMLFFSVNELYSYIGKRDRNRRETDRIDKDRWELERSLSRCVRVCIAYVRFAFQSLYACVFVCLFVCFCVCVCVCVRVTIG